MVGGGQKKGLEGVGVRLCTASKAAGTRSAGFMCRREPSEGSLTGRTEHRIMSELESLKDLGCWTFYFTGRKNTTSPKATQPNPVLSPSCFQESQCAPSRVGLGQRTS